MKTEVEGAFMIHLRLTTFTVLLLCLTYLNALAQPAYRVGGRCHDYGTALGLKARVSALVNGRKQPLGECLDAGKFKAKTGTFEVLVPATATYLILEMPGYRTVDVPIHFEPNIPAEARFTIGKWGEMTALDSLPKQPSSFYDNVLRLYFRVPDSAYVGQINYTLTDIATGNQRSTSTHVTAESRSKLHEASFHESSPGEYKASLTLAKGHFEYNETVTVKAGLTFAAVQTLKTNVAALPHAPTTATLYFDQSSPDLRPDVQTTLDSLAKVLTANPALRATITGYTDNVGRRDLNLTLSEYRARRVATYLTQRGVSASQLTAQWKGPATTAPSTTEATKARSRRVEVRVE